MPDTAAQKNQFLNAVRDTIGELARLTARVNDIAQAYADRGYDPAATDPITQAQLDPFGVLVYDLGSAINLYQALTAFMDDPARAACVSKWRQV